MTAKLLKSGFQNSTAKNPESSQESSPESEGAEEIWSSVEQGRYSHSYELLSDALISIIEKIYLPREVMQGDPETGDLYGTEETIGLYKQLKSRFFVSVRNEGAGQLEVEITPSPLYPGLLQTGLPEPYANGPLEIRNMISSFFAEMPEITAGIPGVRVDAATHTLGFNNPQAFYDMVAAICEAYEIPTSEEERALYASGEWDLDSEDPELVEQICELTGRHIQENIRSDDKELAKTAQIPEPVFRSLSPQNYGWQEIGYLVHRFRKEESSPLFSMKALQDAVAHDLRQDPDADGQESNKRQPPRYHLH